MRRIDRLFAISEVLRGRRTGITAEALAERFEVSVRTIHRDLDALRTAALPIMGERGRGGGLVLDSSYSLPPVNFTAKEAAVLVTAGRLLERARLLPFIDTLHAAIDKVNGALPAVRQREVLRLSKTLDWVGVPARVPDAKVRATVEEAWLAQAPLWILYDGSKGRSERTVMIDSVVMERTMTLLNCRDLKLDAPRQFQFHLIIQAHLQGPPPDHTPRPGVWRD